MLEAEHLREEVYRRWQMIPRKSERKVAGIDRLGVGFETKLYMDALTRP
jgi:hypothetical protein